MLFIRRHSVPFRLGVTHCSSVLFLFTEDTGSRVESLAALEMSKVLGMGKAEGWGQSLVICNALLLASLCPTQIAEHEILSLLIDLHFTQGHTHILCLLFPIFPIICGPESSPRRVRTWRNEVPGWGDGIYVGHGAVYSFHGVLFRAPCSENAPAMAALTWA